MKIGFIGMNNMGKTLIEAFLHAQTFLPTEIIVYDRDKEKADSVTTQYPRIFVARHSRELVKEVSCFFMCIREEEYREICKEIQHVAKPSQVMISLISSLLIKDLEIDLPCKIAKMLSVPHPSRSPKVCFYLTGTRMNQAEELWLEQLLSTISKPQKKLSLR